MQKRVTAIIVTAAAGAALLLVARTPTPTPASSARGKEDPGAAAPSGGAAAARRATYPQTAASPEREPDPSLPDIADFAPAQRAAVREVLARGRPDAALVETIHAKLAALDDDDHLRRRALARELDPLAVIVRCEVLATGARNVTAHFLGPSPELAAEVGERRVLALGEMHGQADVLAGHGLERIAEVHAGRLQTLLIWRRPPLFNPRDICVLASPPLDHAAPAPAESAEAAPPDTENLDMLADFEPATRAAARELMDAKAEFLRAPQSPVFDWLGAQPGRVAPVRCEASAGLFGAIRWRAQAAAPELGISAGDRLELFDWQAQVAARYALPSRDPPRAGEVRTLLVWHVVPYGLGLHRRFLLLASPPLSR